MKVIVELDGEQIPLDECDWALFDPQGSCVSICSAVTTLSVLADERSAWYQWYSTVREQTRKRKQGYTVRLLKRADAVQALLTPIPKEDA